MQGSKIKIKCFEAQEVRIIGQKLEQAEKDGMLEP